MYYVDWCEHCVTFTDIFEVLATKLAENKQIELLKINLSENEVLEMSFEAYPTLMFYHRDDKQNPIEMYAKPR